MVFTNPIRIIKVKVKIITKNGYRGLFRMAVLRVIEKNCFDFKS